MIPPQKQQDHPTLILTFPVVPQDLREKHTAMARQPQESTNPSGCACFQHGRGSSLHAGLQASATAESIRYKIASTREERESAFRLIYRSYFDAGLTDPNASQMRVSPYHMLPTTQMFVAMIDDEVIFSVSLVPNGALGLPMESIYPREVAQRRRLGQRLAEVTCLADRPSSLRDSFPVFLQLCRLMVQYACRQQIDQILVAVHPRHVGFYRRTLRFELIGNQRDYPMVRNRPAVPLVLDFAALKVAHPKSYDAFFGEQLSDDLLRSQPIPPVQRDYFAPMVDFSRKAA